MINNDDNDKPQYKKIWKEYLEYLKTYNSIKQSFFNNYIYKNLDNNNNKITWTIDFDKKEVIING